MNRDAFYVSLWLVSLMLAVDPSHEPFPDEMNDLAERYFRAFPPLARA